MTPIESAIRSQLPRSCLLSQLDRTHLSRTNAIVAAGEDRLARRLSVYLAQGPGSDSFLLRSSSSDAIVLGSGQRDLVSIAREILVPAIDELRSYGNLCLSLVLQISALDALHQGAGDLAAALFCQSLLARRYLLLGKLMPEDSDDALFTSIGEGRLCIWALPALHEIGHLYRYPIPAAVEILEVIRAAVSKRMYEDEVAMYPGIERELEEGMASGGLSTRRLAAEVQADAFAIECLLRSSDSLLGRDVELSTIAAESIVWLCSMALVERLKIRLTAPGDADPGAVRTACVLSDGHFHTRILSMCEYVCLLNQNPDTRETFGEFLMTTYRHIRRNDWPVAIASMQGIEIVRAQRIAPDEATVEAIVEITLEGAPLAESIDSFLRRAGRLSTAFLQRLRVAAASDASWETLRKLGLPTQ